MVQRASGERRVSAKTLLVGVLVPLWLLLSAFALIAFVAGWFSGRIRG